MGACAAVEVACGDGGGRDDAGATPTSPTGIASTTVSSDSDGTATDAPTTTEGTDSASPSTGEPTGTTGTPAGCNTLTVDPPQVTIMIDNGVHAPVQLNAFCDGAPVTATWSTDASYVASVDEKGLVEAGGQYGGQIVVEALHGNKTAEATVDVFLKIDLVPPEITEADKTILDGATMPDTAVLSYPYDGTVFPKGLSPAELMWHGSTPGDKYLVRYSGQFVDAKIYTLAEPPSRHTITKPLWVQISESSSGLPLNLDVHRMPAGQQAAFVLADDTWTIASEKLIGSVYYWANSLGRVLRINPGADAPEDFLLAGGYDGCSTCHSASGDGTRLILGGDIDVSTWDLVNNVPVFTSTSIGVPVRSWAMSAISPDGTVVIENGETNLPGPPGGQPGMWDATTGAKLMGTGIDDLILNMPAFSSDGRKIAYVDHGTLSLMALDYDAAARTASNPVKLVDPGPDVTMNGIIFPSVTPDGRYVIYHRGAYPAMLDTRNGTSDMFLASIEQPGTEIRLRAGNGDDYAFYAGDRDRHWNYEPTFAPRASGGYNWAVFTSRRTFGNKLEGDKNSVKQLWLVAIDENPQPGVDPSHPAFWLHGQDVNTLNMRGFWVHKNDDPGG